MKISIDDGFTELYEGLKNQGYEIYKTSEGANADVIIYSGRNMHLASINSSVSCDYGDGAFLINGDDKSESEIDAIIRNRVYSSIF